MALVAPQGDSALVENFSSLRISESDSNRDYVDRDSANQSPLDYLMINSYSDARSEASNDSGKGGSDFVATNGDDYFACDVMTPPTSPPIVVVAVPAEGMLVYEFEVPQAMCGLLIGKNGVVVNSIRAQTGANLIIRKHPNSKKMKLCSVEGTRGEIDEALALIRSMFPLKTNPNLTLAQVNAPAQSLYVLPDTIQLQLTPGLESQVVVSAIVSPNQIFVQDVNNPTYPSLGSLDLCMAQCYNEFETPQLPRPVQPNLVCAAQSDGAWYRVKVVGIHSDKISDDEQKQDYDVDICYVDYGGYATVPLSSLRQIRADFISLPFQAIECLLANISPLQEEGWSAEACAALEELTREQVLQTELVGYTLEGLPLIQLYRMTPEGLLLVNRELVDRGFALWVEPEIVQDCAE